MMAPYDQEADVPQSPAEHVEAIKEEARRLAETLKAASEAGVSHALILPQLMLVFREAFGEMPAGFPSIPGLKL